MYKHILIPTDGSDVAAKAINAGVALAKEMGAKVTGFYAEEPPWILFRDDDSQYVFAVGCDRVRRVVSEVRATAV